MKKEISGISSMLKPKGTDVLVVTYDPDKPFPDKSKLPRHHVCLYLPQKDPDPETLEEQ